MRIFVGIFLLFLFCLGIAWMRVEINRSGRTIRQLQNEVEVKEARNQYLKLEILRLSGPETILQQADEKLHMAPIAPHRVVVLPKE